MERHKGLSPQQTGDGDNSKPPEIPESTLPLRQLHEVTIDPDVEIEILNEIRKIKNIAISDGDKKALFAQVNSNIEKIVERNAKTIIPRCAGFGEQPGLTFENWNPMKEVYYSALNFAPYPDADEPEIATLLGARLGSETPCRFNDGISGTCWKGSTCKYSHPIGNVQAVLAQPPVILAKSLPKKLVSPTGAYMKVRVCYIIDPLDFFVVPTDEFRCICGVDTSPNAKKSSGVVALRNLMNRFGKFMNFKFRGYQTDIYETNQLVACRLPLGSVTISGFSGFPPDGGGLVEPEWHRGVVLKQTKADLKAKIAVVEVQLIDVGLKISIPFVDCASLPKQYTTAPAMAYHCCLFGIIPLENKFSHGATAHFEELVKDKEVLLTVRTTIFPKNQEEDNSSFFEDPPYHVDLRILPDRFSGGAKGSATKKDEDTPTEGSSSPGNVDSSKSDKDAGYDNPPVGTTKKIKYPSESASAVERTGARVNLADGKLDASSPSQPSIAMALANDRALSTHSRRPKDAPRGSECSSDPEEFVENSAKVLAAKAKVTAEHAKYEKEKVDLTSEKDISAKIDDAVKKFVSRGPGVGAGVTSSSRNAAKVAPQEAGQELLTHKVTKVTSGVPENDKAANKKTETKKPSRFKPTNVVELLAEKGYGFQENPFPNIPGGMNMPMGFLQAAFLLQPTCSCNLPIVFK